MPMAQAAVRTVEVIIFFIIEIALYQSLGSRLFLLALVLLLASLNRCAIIFLLPLCSRLRWANVLWKRATGS
jgi:hypothetical protein